MKSLLLTNIAYIVSCDNQDRTYENASILIEDGVITRIGTFDNVTADRVIDCKGGIVYPGLINTHHHLYQTFSRNLPHVQNMELFPWLTALYEIWKNLDEDSIYYSSITGMGELLKTGTTTVFDHHYVFPNETSERILPSQAKAAKDLGVRMHFSRGSMSLSKKDGGLPPDSVVQDVDKILKDSAEAVKKYHDPSFNSMSQVALAPCSPFSVTDDLLRESAKLARELGVRIHTHLCETKDEERFVLERTGMRPLAYMESLGWIGPDVWYAHGIHFNDDELKRLKETGTGIAHCPISNMKLASGICRIPEMLKMGIKVGLAVDGSASNDGSSMLEEMRVCYLLHRLNSSYSAPSGYDILKMATRGSASVLGREDIGQLAVGKAGDLFMIDPDCLQLVGADFDPKSMLATVGYRKSVNLTVIKGEVVVENGKLTGIDEDKAAHEARHSVREYLKKAGL